MTSEYLYLTTGSATHLYGPPPVPSVHLTVDPTCPLGVGIVSFWGKYKVLCELWVPEECLDTKDDVAMVKMEVFPSYFKNIALEGGRAWQLVDDAVQLIGGAV